MPRFRTAALLSRSRLMFLAGVCTLLSACAAVTHAPAVLTPAAAGVPGAPMTLQAPLQIQFNTGYARSLAAGSQWTLVGSVPHGKVYKPHNNVFTLEGAHMHEAYLVVDNGRLVGFYLPAEGGFSPLERKLAITFN